MKGKNKHKHQNMGRTPKGYWHGYPIKAMKVSDLIPYDNNPRRNDNAVPAVVASIKAVGFINPIVIDADNTIINGHTRRLAAIKLGMEEVPCIQPTDLTPNQVRLLRLADNKTSELSNWDFAKLDEELDALELDFEMGDFGFTTIEARHDEESQEGDSGERCDSYSLMVKCKDANDCESLYNELTEKGYECQISTL